MRTILRSAILADAELNAEGIVSDRFFAVDVDTPQGRPFMQLRWGSNSGGLDVVTRRFLVIWVHDEPGDYSRIDRIIQRLRVLLSSLAGTSIESQSILAIEWTGDSEDLTDDGHQTIARNASFTIVGSGQ
jgi:hypothetical protein